MKLLTDNILIELANKLDIEPALLYAIWKVESAGSGFYLSEGKWKGELKVLFEGHYFHRFTKGRFAKQRPDLSYPKWTRRFYRRGQEEFTRFMEALALDKRAALLSTSWGAFQTMGANFKLCGYDSVEEMVDSYYKGGEPEQLLACVEFCKNRNLLDFLKKHQFDKFAEGYNGKSYKKNRYDEKLSERYLEGLKILK